MATVRKKLPHDLTVDPTNLPIRAHEILEDALRDHLSGIDDEGSGAAYPETYADLQGTRVVLAELAPLITARAPHLVPAARPNSTRCLGAARHPGRRRWTALGARPLAARAGGRGDRRRAGDPRPVPDLLEVPPSR